MATARRSLATLVVVLVAAATLNVSPASARTAPERMRTGDHFPVSVNTTVPAGGTSMITTPTLTRTTDVVKVSVKPQADATPAEVDVFEQMTHVMGKMTKGKRLLVCVLLHNILVQGGSSEYDAEYDVRFASIALAVLGACLQLAGLLAQSTQDVAEGHPTARSTEPSRAAHACDKAPVKVPASVEQTDTGYVLSVAGTTSKATRPPLRVSCRVKGERFIYKVRARKQGAGVRSVVGKKLSVGLLSPSDASTSVPVRVTFATP